MTKKSIKIKNKDKILFEYSSNNSGGRWWLKEKDWLKLQKAGWKILPVWASVSYRNGNDLILGEDGLPVFIEDEKWCKKGEDWLGTKYKYAYKLFSSPKECFEEFEEITGEDVSDEGCNCCGAPHCFHWNREYASGEQCLNYLYDKAPKSLREAVELLNNR